MARFWLVLCVVLTVSGTAAQVNAAQDQPTAQTTPSDLGGLHDFDFLVGEWRVHSRRLKERLAGSNAELVKVAVDLCAQYDVRPATPAEARSMLGLAA